MGVTGRYAYAKLGLNNLLGEEGSFCPHNINHNIINLSVNIIVHY